MAVWYYTIMKFEQIAQGSVPVNTNEKNTEQITKRFDDNVEAPKESVSMALVESFTKDPGGFGDGALSKEFADTMVTKFGRPDLVLYNSEKFQDTTTQQVAAELVSSQDNAYVVFNLPKNLENKKAALAKAQERMDFLTEMEDREGNDPLVMSMEKQIAALGKDIAKTESVIGSIDAQKILDMCISTPDKLKPENLAFFTSGPEAVATLSELIGLTVKAGYTDAYISSFLSTAAEGSLDMSLATTLEEVGKKDIIVQYANKFSV